MADSYHVNGPAELEPIFGATACAAYELLLIVRDRGFPGDMRERARRALVVLDPDSPLGSLPQLVARPSGPGPVAQAAAAVADLTTYALTAASAAERVELAQLVCVVLQAAERVRPRLETLGGAA